MSGLLLLPHPDLVLLCFAVQLPLLITTHGFCGGGNALEDLAMIASSKTAALDFFDFVMKAVDLEWFGSASVSFLGHKRLGIRLSRFPADFSSFRGLYHISVSVAKNPKANIDDLKYKVGEKKF